MDRGVPIRSVSRCITVLQAINHHGALSLMEVARNAELPYPTVCRIVQTLIQEGLVECEATRKCYRATGLVHALSRGFHNRDELVTKARPFLVELTKKTGWPISILTRVGQTMIIRDTTFDLSALTTELFPTGHATPLLESAAGTVLLANLTEEDRASLVELDRRSPRTRSTAPFDDVKIGAQVRQDGFFLGCVQPHDANPEGTSSINVPLYGGAGLSGVLSLLFFSATIDPMNAVERYLPDLKVAASSIAYALDATYEPPARSAALF